MHLYSSRTQTIPQPQTRIKSIPTEEVVLTEQEEIVTSKTNQEPCSSRLQRRGVSTKNRYASTYTVTYMSIDIGGVYRVDFPSRDGGELYGPHYAVVLSDIDPGDHTLLVAPIVIQKPRILRNRFISNDVSSVRGYWVMFSLFCCSL